MKKLISLFLIATLIVSMSVNTFAATNSTNDSVLKNSKAKVVDISYDQYIKILADTKKVSIEEAKKIDEQDNKEYAKKLSKRIANFNAVNANTESISNATTVSANDFTYRTVETDVAYPGNSAFVAALVATFKIYSSGSFRDIESVLGISSNRVSGIHTYAWTQSYTWQDPGNSSMPVTKVNYGAVGFFSVTASQSVTGQAGIAGFAVSYQVGDTVTYQSQSMAMQTSYSVY